MRPIKRLIFVFIICFSVISAILLAKIFFFPSEKFCAHIDLTPTVVPPTCTRQGYTVYSCDDCSFFFHSDFTEPVSHELTYTVIEPSCSKSGFTSVVCAICEYSYKDSYTEPKNHSIRSKTIEPDCENAGYTEYYCAHCDFSYTADKISANTHSYISTVTLPTCTEEGFTTLACSLCDSRIFTEYVKPTGHDYVDERIYVTSQSDGYTKTTCSACDLNEKSEYVYAKDVYMGARTGSDDFIAYGIDVSRYNEVSWSLLKNQGVEFAILRAADNKLVGFRDPTFEYNYKYAKENGIDVGAYVHVNASTVEEIYEIVDNLLPILEGKKFEYPIYFDIERDSLGALGKDLITEMCVTFITELQAHGYFSALYTNENWLKNFYHTHIVESMFDIWYARYPGGAAEPEWNTAKYGKKLGMWQYSEEGTFNGHTGAFDLNYSYKDYPKIMKRFHLNGY